MVRGLPATDHLAIERAKLYQDCFTVSLGIAAVYEALMLILFNASIGKLIFGLRVACSKDGRNIYISKLLFLLRAFLKMFSIYLLSALPFVFLCLTAFSNPERRSGFDLFTGTKVFYVRSKKQ